jgi:hypothetical protein
MRSDTYIIIQLIPHGRLSVTNYIKCYAYL